MVILMKKYHLNKIFIVLLFLIALVLAICISELIHNKNEVNNEVPSGTPVTSLTIKTQAIEFSEEFPGRATSYQQAEIRPQVSGIIIDRLFIEGSNVKKGQQLYNIDPTSYQALYDSAKASLEKAEAILKSTKAQEIRYKDLIKVKAISDQDYDNIIASSAEAQADVNIAKANFNIAKINLEYTKVYAPINGWIGKSSVTIGALVNANQTDALATITQLDPIYVDATRASEDLVSLRKIINFTKNQSVNLFFQDKNDPYKYIGKLEFFDVIVDPSTSSFPLRMLFPNPDNQILPGMFVRTKVNIINDSAILIPQQATIRGADGDLSVWIINAENKVNQVKIKADKTIGNMWLVSEGLNENDRIILEGIQKIAPGMLVHPTEIKK